MRAEALLAARRRSRNTAAGGTSSRPLRVSGRVLDVGCGRGHFLAAMAGRGWDCYGTERAEFPAGDAPKAAGQGTITLVKGAFDDLPFADGFFDGFLAAVMRSA